MDFEGIRQVLYALDMTCPHVSEYPGGQTGLFIGGGPNQIYHWVSRSWSILVTMGSQFYNYLLCASILNAYCTVVDM
jgi:hypothetical protein